MWSLRGFQTRLVSNVYVPVHLMMTSARYFHYYFACHVYGSGFLSDLQKVVNAPWIKKFPLWMFLKKSIKQAELRRATLEISSEFSSNSIQNLRKIESVVAEIFNF